MNQDLFRKSLGE